MKYLLLLLMAVRFGDAAPQRIVSTAPSITETLFAMNLGSRVVGVTVYCKFPLQAAKLPKIGTYLDPDIEAIVALHPDLVVVQQQSNHLGEQLARLHIASVQVKSENLQDIYAGARAIGKAAGANSNAEEFVASMQSRLQSIQKRAAQLPRPTAAFVVGHNPGSITGLIIGAGSSYFSDLLSTAGGNNVFKDALSPYPNVSLEDILTRNPDVILELSGESRPKQDEVAALWKDQHTLRAVQSGRVYALASGAFLIPGPRAVEAATILFHLLHPGVPI